jgi:NAD(P)H-hydrate repair Nnr-like enzyme with NAD(P)H-hydrate dehydratase domain
MTSRGKEKLSHQKFYLHIPLYLDHLSSHKGQRKKIKTSMDWMGKAGASIFRTTGAGATGAGGGQLKDDVDSPASASNVLTTPVAMLTSNHDCQASHRFNNCFIHKQQPARRTAGHRETPTPVGSLFVFSWLNF